MDDNNGNINPQDPVNYGANPVNDSGVNYGPDPVNNNGGVNYGPDSINNGSSYGATQTDSTNYGQQYGAQPGNDNQNNNGQYYQNSQYNSNMQYNSSMDDTKHPLNIAALVCGILSIIGYCVPVINDHGFLILALGVAAIVCGVKGKNLPGAGLGKAGFICGIVGCVIFVLLILLVFAGVAAFLSTQNSLSSIGFML